MRAFSAAVISLDSKFVVSHADNLPFAACAAAEISALGNFTRSGRWLDWCCGVSFIDSTTSEVCDTHRIHNHKVLEGIAERGKGFMGWFYGLKLHLVINDRGEILACQFHHAQNQAVFNLRCLFTDSYRRGYVHARFAIISSDAHFLFSNQLQTATILSLKDPFGTNFLSNKALPIVKPQAPESHTSSKRL